MYIIIPEIFIPVITSDLLNKHRDNKFGRGSQIANFIDDVNIEITGGIVPYMRTKVSVPKL